MGCACKQKNRILNRSREGYSNKSGNALTSKVIDFTIGLINKGIIIILLLVMIPVVVLTLIFNLITKGRLVFHLPKRVMREAKTASDLGVATTDAIPRR